MINYDNTDWGWERFKKTYPYFEKDNSYVWNNELTEKQRLKRTDDILKNICPHPCYLKLMIKIIKALDYYEEGMKILQPRIKQQNRDMDELVKPRIKNKSKF